MVYDVCLIYLAFNKFFMQKIFIPVLSLLTILACSQEDSSNQKKAEQTQFNKSKYSEIGTEITSISQSVLSVVLMNAISERGLEYALGFCNVNALAITDSLSSYYDVEISRISDKNRNSLNAASEDERLMISKFSEDFFNGEFPQPNVIKIENRAIFYQPILVNENCMKCHGKLSEQIDKDLYAKILELYPDDKAVGYEPGQVRGLWKLVFNL